MGEATGLAAPRADGTCDRDLDGGLVALYGAERAGAVGRRLRAVIEAWRGRIPARPGPAGRRFTAADAVLIAYPDHLTAPGEVPLATLARWCREHLRGAVSTVHVLPFHPSTSYEGYAITDYLAVDPRLGAWGELEALGRDFGLMFDLVLNHCSSAHPWFEQLRRDEEPGRRYFVTVPDPAAPWLARVRRARGSPLTHPVPTPAGVRHVWTTYSADLVDLDWREPDLLVEFAGILLDAAARGATLIRLDAFGYVWKEEGTTCVDRPGGHRVIAVLRALLAEAGAGHVALLPSVTNVTQEANRAYLGTGPGATEADLVYLLPLPGLVLHALYRHDASRLAAWLAAVPPAPPGRAYLTLTATHDGIGLTWLRDLLPAAEVAALVDGARTRGARLSSRPETPGVPETPWELNATWTSACAPDPGEDPELWAARVLATQTAVMALRGVPAFYLATFLAARDDHARAEAWGDHRAVNRARFEAADRAARAAVPGSLEARVLAGLVERLRIRAGIPAFDPEAAQEVVPEAPCGLLAVRRTPVGAGEPVLALTSFAGAPLGVPQALLGRAFPGPGSGLVDRLTGRPWRGASLPPYGAVWLTRASR